MTPTVIITAALGLLPFITGYASFRLAGRSATEQARAAKMAVDAQAYERARVIYDQALTEQRHENDRCREDLAAARITAALVPALRADVDDRDRIIRRQRDYIDTLRRRLGDPRHVDDEDQ